MLIQAIAVSMPPAIMGMFMLGYVLGTIIEIIRRSLLQITTQHYDMSERMVEIPVCRNTRNKIKEKKGILSYDQFLRQFV